MKTVLALTALVSVGFSMIGDWEDAWKETVVADFDKFNHKGAFRGWKLAFNKEYANIEEEAHRFQNFMKNWFEINQHNKRENITYTLKLNQFADLNSEEFKYYVHGKSGSCFKSTRSSSSITSIQDQSRMKKVGQYIKEKEYKDIPTSVDWTTQGVVTPVKNQGSCGSCWAFSTTGSIESSYAIATGKLVSLSEQELVDCSDSYGNYGCDGGLMDNAFQYVIANGGLCTEEAYPYLGVDGTCKSTSCSKNDPIKSYTDVTQDSESSLESAVAIRPVSVAIEADQFSFQFYSSGVLTGSCGTNLDHGVLAVGYGVDGSQEYWKVKNSWGTTWGMEGYVLICRDCNKNGAEGECGINMEPSYPVS